MRTRALANIGDAVASDEVAFDAPLFAEFVDYLRWLADQDTGFLISAGNLWTLFYEGIRIGRVWSEVCEDLDLPVREDW